jgi:hypothetical protein
LAAVLLAACGRPAVAPAPSPTSTRTALPTSSPAPTKTPTPSEPYWWITPVDTPSAHIVAYWVTECGADVTYTPNGSDVAQEGNVALPWHKTVSIPNGAPAYVSAQNTCGQGAITCALIVDGSIQKQTTSAGAYVIASCSGNVP